jgi:hypothetical protein
MPGTGVQLDEIDLLFLCAAIGLLGWAVYRLALQQDVMAADLADAHEMSRKAYNMAAGLDKKGLTDE